MPEKNLPGYRYPGTRPFGAEDSHIFMGRGEDIENLVQKMRIQKLLVLYSRSGLGKSSLINARLVAALAAEEAVLPIVVRIGAYVKGAQSPLEKLTESLHARFPEAAGSTGYAKLFKGEPIASHALWYLVKSIQLGHPEWQEFILVFDQFEELFTYPREMVEQFGKALAEMFFVSVPQQLRTKLNAIRQTQEDLPDENRKMLGTPVNIKLLMAIRSDKMSLLNNLATFFPAILQNCYELKALSREQATEAIVGPASLAGAFLSPPFTYTPAAVRLILDGLTRSQDETAPGTPAEIETFQLQIVCKYAENLVVNKNTGLIDASDLGEINTIFENHYRNIIAALPAEQRLPARKLLEEKLIVDGIRISMPKVSILKEPGMTETLLSDLVDTHILRPEQDNYFEIAHDTLVLPIMRYYDERKLEELKENELKQLEEKAREEKNALEKELADQAARNRRRKRRIQSTALLSILGLLGIFTVVLLRQNNAIKTKGMAFSLLSQALVEVHRDPTDALRLAYRALENSDDSLIVNGAFSLLENNTFYKTTVRVSAGSYIQILSDDSTVITGSPTGADTLWSVDGEVLHTFKTLGKIRAAGISSDGKWLVLGDENGRVVVHNSKGGFEQRITGEHFPITTARFSPDGKDILVRSEEPTGYGDGMVKLFNREGKEIAVLGHGICAEFSADGRFILVGTSSGTLEVHSNNGKLLKTLSLYTGSIMTITSSDKMLVAGAWNGLVNYWVRDDGNFEKIDKPKTLNNEDACLAAFIVPGIRQDGTQPALFTGTSGKGQVNIWANDKDTSLTKWGYLLGTGVTKSIMISRETGFLYTCSSNGRVLRWTEGPQYILDKFQILEPNIELALTQALVKLSKEEKLGALQSFYKLQFADSATLTIRNHVTTNK